MQVRSKLAPLGLVKTRLQATALSLTTRRRYACPVCSKESVFLKVAGDSGVRANAMCGFCKARERHRLLWLVLQSLEKSLAFSQRRMLHFAPEPCLSKLLKPMVASYTTADIDAPGVDFQADICELPFAKGSFDLVIACHVLEHVKDDLRALAEIRRVLAPGGVAILPVPIVSDVTVEYPESNMHDSRHVRAPGLDYYDRYRPFFPRMDVFRSRDFAEQYQVWNYENRADWPTKHLPLRRPQPGIRHEDYIPVCF